MPLQFFVVVEDGVTKQQGKAFCLYVVLLCYLSSSGTTEWTEKAEISRTVFREIHTKFSMMFDQVKWKDFHHHHPPAPPGNGCFSCVAFHGFCLYP